LDTRITTLGHVQRGGSACAYDRYLATLQGVEAVNAVLDATPTTPTPFIAINENKITRKPLVQAVEDTKQVAKAIEERDFDRAMGLRDTEFSDFYNSYMTTTTTDIDDSLKVPTEKVRLTCLYFETHILKSNSECELQSSTLAPQPVELMQLQEQPLLIVSLVAMSPLLSITALPALHDIMTTNPLAQSELLIGWKWIAGRAKEALKLA
jgi:6-phosphofructokinase 1